MNRHDRIGWEQQNHGGLPGRWKSGFGLISGFAIALISAGPVAAQESQASADPFAGVEEMIVTGGGTADLLAPSTTSSISFDSKELANVGVQDVSDLAAYVPNLEISTVNATNASFFVRGVGLQDFGANASSSVPIYQDGMPRNASAVQLVGLFDVGGLSVMKGPVGSGSFRNASAGAFVVSTTKPEPDFSGSAKVTLAQISSVDARDASRYSFETAMNAPIYDDIVSARIAARYSHENPFWENGCANRTPIADRPLQSNNPNAPTSSICGEFIQPGQRSQVRPFLPTWIGEVDDYAIRGQIRVNHPESGMDWIFRGERSNLNRDSTAGQHLGTGLGLGGPDTANYRDPDITRRATFLIDEYRAQNPGTTVGQARAATRPILAKELVKDPLDRRPYRGDVDYPGRTLLETTTVSTTGLIEFDAVEMVVDLGYIDYRKSEIRDTDLSPNPRFASDSDDQGWQIYGDVGLKGDAIAGIPIEWDTGVYSLTEKVEARQTQFLLVSDQINTYTQEIYSWGLYGQASYEFLESFTLKAGFRYNWERKDFEVQNIREEAFRLITESANQRTWDAGTGFASLEYAFTEDISSYIKYSRGFKAGHFNPSRANKAKDPNGGFADPEQIDAFEWGLNAGLWSSRLQGNASFFFYNYKNYQVFRLTTSAGGVFREVQNAKQARNYGAELELNLTPLEGYVPEMIEGLRITLRGGWLEASFVEFTVDEQRVFDSGAFGVSIDYSGNSLLNAPNLQASAIFTWPLVLDRFGTLTPQYDFTWTDDTPFDPANGKGEPDAGGQTRFPAYTIGNRAYMLHNVRLSWAPPGDPGVELAGWCRNVADERYKTFAVDLSTFSGQQLVYVADPRTCGADIRFTW